MNEKIITVITDFMAQKSKKEYRKGTDNYEILSKTKACCFTGHRNLNAYNQNILFEKIKENIALLIEKENVKVFYCGMAIGTDMLCADVVLSLKELYNDILLYCAISFETQSKGWNLKDREKYNRLLGLSDANIVLQTGYSRGCYQKRNIYMVDRSDFILAIYNGSSGGTRNTINYGKSKSKQIINVLERGEN